MTDAPEKMEDAAAVAYRNLLPGDPLPQMIQASGGKARFGFHTLAGRYQLYAFHLSADPPAVKAALAAAMARRDLFNDIHCSLTAVSVSATDRDVHGLADIRPGVRIAWDFDYRMSLECGAIPLGTQPGVATAARRLWILTDPSLHVLKVFPWATPVETVLETVAALPPPDDFGGVFRPAPILMLPNVLEPEVCRELIGLYRADGGADSGVYREGAGVVDHGFKRRRDYTIGDPQVLERLSSHIARRVAPEIEKLFFMKVRYSERHIIGCYAAGDGGHFAPHTDIGEGLTAHRRYALSINLNDDFDGGEVVFPEYGNRGYKAPAGWAVVFPCAILHQVRRVTRGERYAYLPFLYDETARAIREANLAQAQGASS